MNFTKIISYFIFHLESRNLGRCSTKSWRWHWRCEAVDPSVEEPDVKLVAKLVAKFVAKPVVKLVVKPVVKLVGLILRTYTVPLD